MSDLSSLLHRTFGHSTFRANQEAVCVAATAGKDVLLVMPTGAGKSLCYQLPALARGGTALVVSPLIALMDDQAAKLSAIGLRVGRIHSGLSRDQSRQACRDYLDGTLNFLFIAPERMRVPGFPEMLARRKPSLVAIDEAHCISAWGHDFRPDYRTLGDHLPALRPSPIIALTATATPTVQQDIVAQLHLNQPSLFIHGFRRENLAIEVVEMSKPRRHEFTARLLADPAARPAIVYAPSRKAAEELAADLNRHFPAAAYHAGLEPAVRERVQTAFQAGKLEVVVATIAFGMGIDKADVRTVVHTALPSSVEAFYQEIGRAGRDGLPARTVLLHSYADRKMHEFFLERDYPPANDLARVAAVLTDEFLIPEPLARSLRMDPDTFQKAIEKLIGQGAATVDLAGNVRRTGPISTSKSGAWRTSYEAQIAFRRGQLDRMVAFAETQQCRMTAVIRHFGDTADAHRPCGHCDFCSPGTTSAQTFAPPTTEQARDLRAILRVLDARSTSTGKLHTELSAGPGFHDIDRRTFDVLLDALARAGLITLTAETFTNAEGNVIPYKKAALTHEGRADDAHELTGVLLPNSPEVERKAAKSSKTRSVPRTREAGQVRKNRGEDKFRLRAADRSPEEQEEHRRAEKERVAKREEITDDYTNQQRELDKRLREWRKAEAAKNGRPAFYVLTDAQLINIVLIAPASISKLTAIKGLGRDKAERFGAEIIALCRGGSVVTESTQSSRKRNSAASALPSSRPTPELTRRAAGEANRTLQLVHNAEEPIGEEAQTFHRIRPSESDPTEFLSPDQLTLDTNLRTWRKSESERIGLPQFFILGASALRSIVLIRPRTIAQLQSISGIGPDKAEKFGTTILDLCNA